MISANSGGTITTYTYDYRNRLTEVTQGGTVIATYTYNALDQRIGIQDSGAPDLDGLQRHEPGRHAVRRLQRIGHAADALRLRAGHGQRAVVDELLARTSSGGTTAWYLTDKLDSVRDIVSSSGSVLDHVVYDSFGNIADRDERKQRRSVQVRGDAVRRDDWAIL